MIVNINKGRRLLCWCINRAGIRIGMAYLTSWQYAELKNRAKRKGTHYWILAETAV